jgi:hypothetical protein
VEPLAKDLFLCHSSVDKEWTMALGERIEREDWGGRKLTVFLDAWDIEPGDNILDRLNRGLQLSRHVALVLSPEMVASDWCGLELTSVLAQDPMNRQRRIVPLLLRDRDLRTGERIDLPPILRPFNYIDFRSEKEFLRGYARLVARVRGEAPPRSGSLRRGAEAPTSPAPVLASYSAERQDPDPIQETLIGNLLPVFEIPKIVWSAATRLATKADLPEGSDLPPFILRENRIHTFADLSAPTTPFAPWLTDQLWKRHAVTEWRNEPDRWRWVVELLNIALKSHMWKQRVSFDAETKRYFFRSHRPAQSVVLKWGAGTKRTVVRAPDPAHGGNWVHQGARLSFEPLGDRLFLAVEPCYVFTTDGARSVRKQDVGPLAMQWSGRERNGAIIRHVLMWSDVLTGGRRTGHIDTGDRPVVIGRVPVTVGMSVGLADDQVGIKALLKFTKAEQDLDVPEEVVYGFLEDEATTSEDDAEDTDG